jgi:hypothetical protein
MGADKPAASFLIRCGKIRVEAENGDEWATLRLEWQRKNGEYTAHFFESFEWDKAVDHDDIDELGENDHDRLEEHGRRGAQKL